MRKEIIELNNQLSTVRLRKVFLQEEIEVKIKEFDRFLRQEVKLEDRIKELINE